MKSALHKVLHPIAGRPMLLHLMASVDELSPEKKVVIVGDKADPLTGHDAGDEYKPLFRKILMGAPAPIGLG